MVVVTCWLVWDAFSRFFSQIQICMLLCVLAWMSNVLTNSGIWIFGFKFTVLFGGVEVLHSSQRKYVTGSGLWELKALHNFQFAQCFIYEFGAVCIQLPVPDDTPFCHDEFLSLDKRFACGNISRNKFFLPWVSLAILFYKSNIIVNNTLGMCNLDVIDIEINE